MSFASVIKVAIIILMATACTSYYKGPKSSNFNGERFFHEWPQAPKNFFTFLKWQWTGQKAKWPDFVPNKLTAAFPTELKPEQIAATFINHATVYLQHAGVRLLTDPHWGNRASPVSFGGPQRVREPGAKLEQLPGVDVVMISHNHYDHFDLETIKELDRVHKPLFLIPLGDAYLMKDAGVTNFKEMDWFDEHQVNADMKITFVPVKHWSARGIADRNKSLWGGYVVVSKSQKIFFAGDTGYCDTFKKMSDRFGEFTLALLPIGAYEPRWFMKDSHMNPEESVQAHLDLKAKYSMSIHFGLWQLTDESIDQPVQDLKTALQKFKVSEQKFFVLDHGETKIVE